MRGLRGTVRLSGEQVEVEVKVEIILKEIPWQFP